MTEAGRDRRQPGAVRPNGAILEAEGVVKRFGGIRAVDGATMQRRARARSRR